jgi:hypothetical protein
VGHRIGFVQLELVCEALGPDAREGAPDEGELVGRDFVMKSIVKVATTLPRCVGGDPIGAAGRGAQRWLRALSWRRDVAELELAGMAASVAG